MKQPTNADLLREIKDVQNTVTKHDKLITEVYDWMIGQVAIAKYQEGRKFTNGSNNSLNKEFVSVVMKFIGVITALLSILYLIVKELVG